MYLYTASAPTLLLRQKFHKYSVRYFHILAITGMHQETEIH